MIDGILRILVVSLGLLIIWWLCGPAGQRDRSARLAGSEAREGKAHVDAQGR
jgi:hypothetical protein